jgi:hypothetical protein
VAATLPMTRTQQLGLVLLAAVFAVVVVVRLFLRP